MIRQVCIEVFDKVQSGICALGALIVHIVFLVQAIHQKNVDNDEKNKTVDGSLLGKPKAKFKSSNLELI